MRRPLATRSLLTVLVAALLAAVLPVAPASAISKQRADRIALRTLKPERQRSDNVVVFGLRRPIAPRRLVTEAGSDRPTSRTVSKRSLKPAGRSAWLYWMDLAHGAMFEHASRLLLVDDRGGRVLARRRLDWYPLIDGRPPAFLSESGYLGTRYQVFSNAPAGRSAAPAARAAQGAPLALPPNAFASDCILAIGDRGPDAKIRDDFAAVRSAARRYGVRYFDVRPRRRGEPVNGRDLRRTARQLAQDENCKDILLYVHGHGAGPPRNAGVEVGGEYTVDAAGRKVNLKPGWVTPTDISGVMRDNPNATFKLKVDSCFSGRFTEAMRALQPPNLLVAEASSAAGELSWFALPYVKQPDGSTLENFTNNPGRTTGDYLSEFTNGNIAGWERFATSQAEVTLAQQAGGSLFARMIERGFALGQGDDFGAITGKTHPQLVSNLPSGQAPPQTDFTPTIGTSYKHGTGGQSTICVDVATSPPQPGATARLRVTGPGVVGTGEHSFTLDANGRAVTDQTIDQPGDYTVQVTVTASDGTVRTTSTTQTVTAAQGTCP